MPDEIIEPREHYVYALYREDGVTPFYIGMGKGRRWKAHDKVKEGDRTPKAVAVREVRAIVGGDVPKRKLYEGLTEKEAFGLEIALIHAIGRAPHGPLTNLTAGGDGVSDHPPESRAKQSESNRRAWADPEKKAARIEAMKAAWTPEKKAEMSAMQEVNKTPEARAKHSLVMKQMWFDKNGRGPKVRPPDNRSEFMKAKWADPETREELQKAIAKAMEAAQSPEANAKRSESHKKLWEEGDRRSKVKPQNLTDEQRQKRRDLMISPEHREKLAISNSPENITKRTATFKETLSDPEVRAKYSAAGKKRWAEQREQILQKRRETREAKRLSRQD